MFLEYIERLREKPYRERRRFAFLVSLGFTAVIAIIWASALPSQVASLTISGDLMGSADATGLGQKVDEAKDGLSSLIEAGKKIQQDLPPTGPTAVPTNPPTDPAQGGSQVPGFSASSSVSEKPIMIETSPLVGAPSHGEKVLIATSSSEQTR